MSSRYGPVRIAGSCEISEEEPPVDASDISLGDNGIGKEAREEVAHIYYRLAEHSDSARLVGLRRKPATHGVTSGQSVGLGVTSGTRISLMLAVSDARAAAEWYSRGLEIEGAPFFLREPTNTGFDSPAVLGTTRLGDSGATIRPRVARSRGRSGRPPLCADRRPYPADRAAVRPTRYGGLRAKPLSAWPLEPIPLAQ